jgi:flagellar biosynthetic protein FliR
MHQFILRAFIDSYQLIPTAGVILKSDHLMESMVKFMTDYCVIGFRICLPVFATILLLNSILGILAKVAPQMNMFSVGMQLKIIVGFTILFLTVRLLPGISDFIFTEMKKMMVSFIGGLY